MCAIIKIIKIKMFMRVHKHDFMEEGRGKKEKKERERQRVGREEQPRPEHLMADAATPNLNRSSSC